MFTFALRSILRLTTIFSPLPSTASVPNLGSLDSTYVSVDVLVRLDVKAPRKLALEDPVAHFLRFDLPVHRTNEYWNVADDSLEATPDAYSFDQVVFTCDCELDRIGRLELASVTHHHVDA